MAVIHYIKNDVILCKTKAKNIKKTEIITEVTCKRCLKKLETPSEKFIKKSKVKFSFVNDRKFKYCIKLGFNTILKLGNNLDDEIGVLILANTKGLMSTSMKFAGSVTQMISKQDINFLRTLFQFLKDENNNKVLVSDVKKYLLKKEK